MSDTKQKSSRVIFTFDRLNCGGKKFYTRLKLQKPNLQKITINDNNNIGKDPVVDFLTNHEASLSEFEEDEDFEVSFDIDVLAINNSSDDIDDGFKQYHANFNSLVDNPFVSISGISKKNWRSWCIRLFFNGEFDGDYKYEIIKRNEKIEWVVKVEHGGIWKVVFLIGMDDVDIDIDEYFIEDLESFYEQINFWKRKSKEWELERKKKVIDMEYLSRIDDLCKSSRELKEKVLKGYTPLINHLLEDRRRLKRKLDDAGEVVFSGVRSRKLDVQALDINHTNEFGKSVDNLEKKKKDKNNSVDKKKQIEDTEKIEDIEKISVDENKIFTFNSTKRKPTFSIKKNEIIKSSDPFSDFGSSSGESYFVQNIDGDRILEKTTKKIIKDDTTVENNQLGNFLENQVNDVHKMEISNENRFWSGDQNFTVQEMRGQSSNSIEISEDTFIEKIDSDYAAEDIDSDKTDV